MDGFPKGGLIGKAVGYWKRLQAMQIPGHAANAGYFIVLSVFPALVLLLSLLRYTNLDARDLLQLLEGFLPEVPESIVFELKHYSCSSQVRISLAM